MTAQGLARKFAKQLAIAPGKMAQVPEACFQRGVLDLPRTGILLQQGPVRAMQALVTQKSRRTNPHEVLEQVLHCSFGKSRGLAEILKMNRLVQVRFDKIAGLT